MREILEKIAEGEHLTREEAGLVLQAIIDEQLSAAQAGALLMGLRQKGETLEEINGFLDVLHTHMVKVTLKDRTAVDVCGTGGDGQSTFNISTTVAFVLAAGGITVAKHGNRSVSSKSGSADVLEALGAKVDLTPEQAKKCADEIQITFFYAPNYHPAMKKIAPYRKSLNIRTVFNLLGPLLNPADVKRQLIGAFNNRAAQTIAGVLRERGHEHGIVVHALDGLDEVSPFSKTVVYEVHQEQPDINVYEFNGFKVRGDFSEIQGQNAFENAYKIRQILEGKRGADRDIVLLNSAFAFKAAGRVKKINEGVRLAEEVIDSSEALKKLEDFVEMTQSFN